MVIVAQLVRALVCGAGGRGFESHQSPIFKKKKEPISLSTPFFILRHKVLSFVIIIVLIVILVNS